MARYIESSPKSVLAFEHQFVSLHVLREAVVAAGHVRFSDKASRDFVHGQLVSLQTHHTKSMSSVKRFPESGRFINVSCGAIAYHLLDLKMNLDLGDDRSGEKQQRSAVQENVRKIMEALSTVEKEKCISAGVFNRQLFETHYGLVWEVSSAK